MHLERLLVIIDPTEMQQPSLERAAWMARHTGAALELLVCEYHSLIGLEALFSTAHAQIAKNHCLEQRQQWLENLAEPLRLQGLRVQCSVTWGKPLHDIVNAHLNATQPDLVFKTARPHNVVHNLLLNNESWQLIRHCAAPLWLVRTHHEWRGKRLAVALDPVHQEDPNATQDRQLIRSARVLEQQLGFHVDYIHSHTPLPPSLVFDAGLIADYGYYVERSGERQRAAFKHLLDDCAIAAQSRHFLHGFAEETLAHFVENHAIDLLIMGAVARGHWDELLIGHTAERVLESAPCDLLVIKSVTGHSA